jgi:glycerol dehydrogenase
MEHNSLEIPLPSITEFPSKYIQGRNVLSTAGYYLKPLGANYLIIGGMKSLEAVGEKLITSIATHEIYSTIETYAGDCTEKEIERLAVLGRKNSVNAVMGVGGGKVIDTAKVVAKFLNVPVAIIPTVASTDAPTSAVSVIYNENGEFSHYVYYNNPDLVLTDTEIIAKSPKRYLISGMGGAIGVSYEAEACMLSRAKTTAGGSPSFLAAQSAVTARKVILKNGITAAICNGLGRWSPALESVVEANFLLSGIGFENGGLAVAHSIYHGYRSINKKDCFHGEVVSFGTLVQMIIECRGEDELGTIMNFYREVGLPYTFKHLHIEDDHEIREIAKAAYNHGTARNMHLPVSPSVIYDAMVLADALGHRYMDAE